MESYAGSVFKMYRIDKTNYVNIKRLRLNNDDKFSF